MWGGSGGIGGGGGGLLGFSYLNMDIKLIPAEYNIVVKYLDIKLLSTLHFVDKKVWILNTAYPRPKYPNKYSVNITNMISC